MQHEKKIVENENLWSSSTKISSLSCFVLKSRHAKRNSSKARNTRPAVKCLFFDKHEINSICQHWKLYNLLKSHFYANYFHLDFNSIKVWVLICNFLRAIDQRNNFFLHKSLFFNMLMSLWDWQVNEAHCAVQFQIQVWMNHVSSTKWKSTYPTADSGEESLQNIFLSSL